MGDKPERKLIHGAAVLEAGTPVVTIGGNRATIVRVDQTMRECVVERLFDHELVSLKYCHVKRVGDPPKAPEPCPPDGLVVLQVPDAAEDGEP